MAVRNAGGLTRSNEMTNPEDSIFVRIPDRGCACPAACLGFSRRRVVC